MAMKQYRIGEYIYQYEEGTEPEGAVEYVPQVKPVEAEAPAEKAQPAPRNKSKKAVATK